MIHRGIQLSMQAFLLVALLVGHAAPLEAHDEPNAKPVTQSALPRLQAQSEEFELVGIVDAGVLQIYLDRFDGNEPVIRATIEISATRSSPSPLNLTGLAQPNDMGFFEWKAEALREPGDWAITFAIQTDQGADLLTAALRVGEAAAGVAVPASRWPFHWLGGSGASSPPGQVDQGAVTAPKGLGSGGRLSTSLALVGLGSAVALAVLIAVIRARGFGAWRRGQRSGSDQSQFKSTSRMGGLAWLLLSASFTMVHPNQAWAHGQDPTPTATLGGHAPMRQSDGRVFLPKPSQRQIEIRTQKAEFSDFRSILEMNARVVMDPSAGGRVQSTLLGRLELAGAAMPSIGQPVRKGQILAQIRPTVAPLDRANQAANAAEAMIRWEAAKKRLERLEQLEGSVPQKDIDAARAEVETLAERTKLARGGLTAVEPLVSPVNGVIAGVHAVLGQIVGQNELIFEIVDPQRLVVEALSYDPAQASLIEQASATTSGGQTVRLTPIGVGRVLRGQAAPVQFRVLPDRESQAVLALGQPLVVRASLKKAAIRGESTKAIELPASALVKSPSQQDIVWVHTQAEVFEPKWVKWRALDGDRIAVEKGLEAGDRVVVRGASLLNQVR